MRLIITLITLLAVGCIFMIFPDSKEVFDNAGESELTEYDISYMKKFKWMQEHTYHDFFLMSDSKVPWQHYAYHLVQHGIIIMLVMLAVERSRPCEVEYINAFLVIQCLDALDFILNNNEKYGNSNLTFNIIAPFLFGAFCVYIYNKNGKRDF